MKRKDIIQLIITGILIIVLLFFLVTALRKKGKPIENTSVNPQRKILGGEMILPEGFLGEKKSIENIKIKAKETFKDLEEKTKLLELTRDPFSLVPKETPIENKPVPLVLNGIMWDDKDPKAIINNDILKVGDTIQGNTVVEIQKDKVILKDGIKNVELSL